MSVPVRPDGKVTTPLVDELVAQGKTPVQIARDVEQALSKFVRDPIVTVIVTGFVGPYSEQIRVVGEAAKLVPQLMDSGLSPSTKVLVQVRQACAEGRVGDASTLYESTASIDEANIGVSWQVLELLGRPKAASRLLAYMDTPVYFNALSSFLSYRYFDVSRYPNLEKVLLAQGIHRPPPQRESYACKLEAETETP